MPLVVEGVPPSDPELHEAAHMGDVPRMRVLLATHADATVRTDADGRTALHAAAAGGQVRHRERERENRCRRKNVSPEYGTLITSSAEGRV
jgi:hypothetical protein